jgi:hypothetical protein
VAPLTEEVRGGLPGQAGRYPIQASSLARDPQGVYHFAWAAPGAAPTSASGWNPASVSLMKLDQGERDELEVADSGDPTLHLRPDTPVTLVDSSTEAVALRTASLTPTPTTNTSSSSGYRSSGVYWYPYYGGGYYGGAAYRDPPSQPLSPRGTVEGARVSTTPPSAESRVHGLSHAVSGQAGGTGGGSAATLKSGAEAARASGGAASSKSSSFSGGRSASSGSSSSSSSSAG